MKSITTLSLALALAGALVAPAMAGTFQFKKAQVELTSPEGWKSSEEEGTITFTAPDDSLAVVFTVLPGKDTAQASEEIDKAVEKAVGEVKWEEKATKETINEMEFEIYDGSAKEGTMDVSAAYINTPAEDIMVMYYFASKEASKKYEKEIVELLKGIKPAKS